MKLNNFYKSCIGSTKDCFTDDDITINSIDKVTSELSKITATSSKRRNNCSKNYSEIVSTKYLLMLNKKYNKFKGEIKYGVI